jgi:hypothetical protein
VTKAGGQGSDVSVVDVVGVDLEAFAIGRPGCFRMVRNGAGRPAHCPQPPTWSGVHRSRKGRLYRVRACEDHRAGLEHSRRLKGGS